MQGYGDYDFLCNEPFFIDGIGTIKCPTLRDIRKIKYQTFSIYINMISIDFENYLKAINLKDQYDLLSEEEKKNNTMYNILLHNDTQILFGILQFFIIGKTKFDKKTSSFIIYDGRKKVGHVGNDNFEYFSKVLQAIIGLKKGDEVEPKFKNNTARKLFEKMQKNAKSQKKNTDKNYAFDNMVRKYCTHNKVGINILNVWDLTYYQFTSMFMEYSNGRQCDFNDMMAANSFNYSKSTDYKPLEYMKKIENN